MDVSIDVNHEDVVFRLSINLDSALPIRNAERLFGHLKSQAKQIDQHTEKGFALRLVQDVKYRVSPPRVTNNIRTWVEPHP